LTVVNKKYRPVTNSIVKGIDTSEIISFATDVVTTARRSKNKALRVFSFFRR